MTYSIDCPEKLEFYVDITLFRQVMSNLVLNARKFSPIDSKIRLTGGAFDKEIRLVVTDEGTGLPAKTGPLFGRYVQGDSRWGGLGLGLYIAKKVVEAHGGKIWAKNGREKGAEFHISIPVQSSGSRSSFSIPV